MDCNDTANDMDCEETLSWPEEGDYLQKGSGKDIVSCLWDELNEDGDSLMHMLCLQTPAKESMDFGHRVFDTGGSAEKSFEDYRESPIVKRRRMLQFDSHETENIDCDYGLPSIADSKAGEECSSLNDKLPETPSVAGGNAGVGCSYGDESLDVSLGDWWPQECLNESEFQYNCDELFSLGDDLMDASEFCNLPAAAETSKVPQVAIPSPRIKFKGRRPTIKVPTMPASVAYPFELFKPSIVQGDVTLHDINRRIHCPPPSKFTKEKDPAFHYPTSAISGKPVVAKTKIRTEGGRGSITITRTKG